MKRGRKLAERLGRRRKAYSGLEKSEAYRMPGSLSGRKSAPAGKKR